MNPSPNGFWYRDLDEVYIPCFVDTVAVLVPRLDIRMLMEHEE